MSDLSVFEIIGPVMVGPSSSHTAGAARLGQIARALFGQVPNAVDILLHGSFANIYKGHCTDKALLGGLLGLSPEDERLKDSFQLAKEQKLEYQIIPKDLGLGFHPNTVRFLLKNHQKKMQITGSSVGGGSIIVSNINGFDVNFTGEYSVLIISHKNTSDFSQKLMKLFVKNKIDIVIMNTAKPNYDNETLTVIELPTQVPAKIIKDVNSIKETLWVREFNHQSHFKNN